jgi:hypothetical protein
MFRPIPTETLVGAPAPTLNEVHQHLVQSLLSLENARAAEVAGTQDRTAMVHTYSHLRLAIERLGDITFVKEAA